MYEVKGSVSIPEYSISIPYGFHIDASLLFNVIDEALGDWTWQGIL